MIGSNPFYPKVTGNLQFAGVAEIQNTTLE